MEKSYLFLFAIGNAFLQSQADNYLDETLRGRIPGLALRINSQTLQERAILPYGYAQLSSLFDTREVYGDQETLGDLFPKPIKYDRFGNDLHAHPKFSMTVTQSTVGLLMRGPSWDYVKTLGVIEADFRGDNYRTLGCFRVRHAFGFLDWQDGSFLLGQFWHPLVIPQCWPNVVNFNGGAPFETIARDPQLRVTKRFDNIELLIALASQRDFASNGPMGPSPEYIRNAVISNIHGQIRSYGEHYFAGFAFDYKRLKPRLISDKNLDVNEHIDSFITEAFISLNYESTIFRLKGIWAENANDQGLISGFAVKTVNPVTDARTYANTAAASVWFDASYFLDCKKENQVGIFLAYGKNLGAQYDLYSDPVTERPIIYDLFGVAQRIDDLFRISPRYIFNHEPFLLGIELEYTQAAWGLPNRRAKVINAKNVGNVRFLIQMNYVF